MAQHTDHLQPQYGSTGQSSVNVTGQTRDASSIGARGSRRSLADEFDSVNDSNGQKEKHVKEMKILTNHASIGQNVDGTMNPDREESNDDDEIGVCMMQLTSRHEDGVTDRHVSFTGNVNCPDRQNINSHNNPETIDSPPREMERERERPHQRDNQNNINDDDDLNDSMSRIRSMTNSSTPNTHSEAEECNESDFSIAMSTDTVAWRRRSRTGSLFSGLITPRRRRRRISRPGARVTDSYADECFCCCSIL